MAGIFDEKCREKEKYRRMSIFKPTLQLVVVNLYTKFEVSILYGCGDIFDKKSGKKETGREEQTGEGPFAIPQYNLSLRTSILNLKFLS